MVYWSNERPETVKLGCWGGYHKKSTIRHFFWDTLYVFVNFNDDNDDDDDFFLIININNDDNDESLL